MKFLCPNCKAKYQISDEKIAGRTLKMDCRRCAHPIVIRGQASAAPPAASVAAASPATASRSSLGADFRRAATPPVAAPPPQKSEQWHVAINEVPVGPMKRDEIRQKIAQGAVNARSLCWREGFDDWRPVKDVPELADLLARPAPAPPPPARSLGRAPAPPARPMAPAAPARPLGAPQPRPEVSRPAARSNVVPMRGGGGAVASAMQPGSDFLEDDEPTRVGAAIDFEKLEEEARAAEEAAAKERAEQEARAAAAAAREEEQNDLGAVAAMAAAPAPRAEVAEEDAFDPFAGAGAPLVAAGAPAAAEPVVMAESAASPASMPPRRRRGLPIGAWIAMAGAAAFGVALAVMVGTYLLRPPPEVATAPPPPAPAAPEPELDLPPDPVPGEEVEDIGEDGEEPDEAPEGTAAAETPRPTTGTGPRTPSTTGTRPQTGSTGSAPRPALDPEAQARLDRFADQTQGVAALPAGSRPAGGLDERPQAGGTGLNADQLRQVISRERSSLQRCYETAVRGRSPLPTIRMDIRLTVAPGGNVTSVRAQGQGIGDMAACLERSVTRWRFPRSSARTETTFPIVFQGTD